MNMTPAVRKTVEFLTEPRTLHEIAAHLRESYDSSKRRCKQLWLDGVLDKVDIEDPGQTGSKLKYVVGAGKRKMRERTPEALAKAEARREYRRELAESRAKQPTHGGRIVMLTDSARWEWGGQIGGYGPRANSAILGE